MKKWIVSQIGAREHYSIARALYSKGRNVVLHTDYFNKEPTFSDDLNDSVISYNFLTAKREVIARTLKGLRVLDKYEEYVKKGEWFSKKTINYMKSSSLDENFVFFSYDTSFLEAGTFVKKHGGKAILGQIDPGRAEMEIIIEEESRWKSWVSRKTIIPKFYLERRAQEWEIADLIVVNSEWSKKSLITQGVDGKKIEIIPLAYEKQGSDLSKKVVDSERRGNRFNRNNPLVVLFLGQVILRKGIQYLVEAARKLIDHPVVFEVVGPIGISPKCIASFPSNIHIRGRVRRTDASKFYMSADVFILPTLSDGFAITQLEAMSYGLPVLVTDCCGDVVTDGIDGIIFPPRNSDEIVHAIELYLNNSDLLFSQSRSAVEKSRKFNLHDLAKKLTNIE